MPGDKHIFIHRLIYIHHLLDSVKRRAGSERDRISAPSSTAESEIAAQPYGLAAWVVRYIAPSFHSVVLAFRFMQQQSALPSN